MVPRSPEDEFVFLACDGVWDVISSQQACDFIRDKVTLSPHLPSILKKFSSHPCLGNSSLAMNLSSIVLHCSLQLLGMACVSDVCAAVVDHCLSRGSTDNITAVLVCFAAAKSAGAVEDMIDSWFDDIGDRRLSSVSGSAVSAVVVGSDGSSDEAGGVGGDGGDGGEEMEVVKVEAMHTLQHGGAEGEVGVGEGMTHECLGREAIDRKGEEGGGREGSGRSLEADPSQAGMPEDSEA